MNVPSFTTSRLELRPVTLEDAPAYERHFVDYEVIRHLSSAVPWPYPKGGIVEFLKSKLTVQGHDEWMWGIFLKEEPAELIGVVHLWREGKPENRGFWLARKHWGKGIMTEAVKPVLDYAFDHLGFDKLILANAVGNRGSHRVKEKTGAKLLRVEPAKFVDPAYTEHEVWELTKSDWKAFSKAH